MLKECFQLCLVKRYCPNELLNQERKRSCPFVKQLLSVHEVQGRTPMSCRVEQEPEMFEEKKSGSYSELQPAGGHELQLSGAER